MFWQSSKNPKVHVAVDQHLSSGWRALTFRVQQFGEPQVLFSQVEGILKVVVSVGLLQLVKVDQIRSE